MVQRYELELYHCNGGEMEPCDEGGYVEYEDYAELERKLCNFAAVTRCTLRFRPDEKRSAPVDSRTGRP